MVLVRLGGDSRVKRIVREPKWSGSGLSMIVLESENGNKGTLHQKRLRQRRKSLTDWGRSDVYRIDTCFVYSFFVYYCFVYSFFIYSSFVYFSKLCFPWDSSVVKYLQKMTICLMAKLFWVDMAILASVPPACCRRNSEKGPSRKRKEERIKKIEDKFNAGDYFFGHTA